MIPQIKTNRLCAILITILIVACAAPLCTANDNSQQSSGQSSQSGESKHPDVPGAPDNAVQYNRTNVTPNGQMEQVRAQEQTMFQYRNMTMLMNCTQNCTVTFTADEEVTPKIFGLSVDPNQTMTLAMNLTKSPLNGAMVNERALNFYLGIEPNATLQLQAQIRLYINQTELNQSMNREVNASRLTWMYWNQTNSQWQAVESYMDQNGYLACNTNHFSTWTVVEIEQSEETPAENSDNMQTTYIIIAVIAVIAIIAIGAVVYKKRK